MFSSLSPPEATYAPPYRNRAPVSRLRRLFRLSRTTGDPHLRGKPVGVVPFKDAAHTCVIACSREAKLHGVKNVMNIEEARERCPDIILVPVSYTHLRAHETVLD